MVCCARVGVGAWCGWKSRTIPVARGGDLKWCIEEDVRPLRPLNFVATAFARRVPRAS